MAGHQALERMRHYLWTLLEQSALAKHPEIASTVITALRSTNPDWIPSVFHWVRIQELQAPGEREKQTETFSEPRPEQLRGRIFIGATVPSGHPVHIPIKSFGQRGHTLVAGAGGTGKSTLLNFISLQLMEYVPTTIYDSLDQSAPILVPSFPPERLGIIDYKDYRRNFLMGPPGMSQMDWVRSISNHLMESLDLEPVGMNALIQLCEEINQEGHIATLPRLLDKLGKPGYQGPSYGALQNRLLPLTLSGQKVFASESGFDLRQMFTKSFIFNLKAANRKVRKLIYHDYYFYLTKHREVLPQWKLKNVFVFHEAGSLVSRASIGRNPTGEAFFLTMMREARNYGIGFIFADQVPHLEHTVVRSNIGTKCLFRLEDDVALETFHTALGLNEAPRRSIMNLPDRLAVLKRPDIPFPFLIRIPILF